MTRTLYKVRPPIGHELDVVAVYDRVYGSIEKAAELWRLIGNDERARAIEDVVVDTHGHEPPAFHTEELRRLLELLTGLDTAVVGPLTDAEHKLSPEKVVELRAKTELLDLGEGRGPDAQWAVAEAVFGITGLQNILKTSIEDGSYLVFD